MSHRTAYIAAGANLGDRAGNIAAAVQALRHTPGIVITNQSRLIENPAVGGPAGSPSFLNGVVEIGTTLTPAALLSRLLEVERSLGRERRAKWEPRAIDLDLVLFGDAIIDEPNLKVPHPLMHERRFVLQPLAEIAPGVVHPILRQTALELLQNHARSIRSS
jgi:2-amino-4-hydroxy-6-hydroxymethyldihydropteridine diphosphokinase